MRCCSGFSMLSAVIGALYTVGQRDLKRLLGYSSTENVGIAGIGFGVGCLGVCRDRRPHGDRAQRKNGSSTSHIQSLPSSGHDATTRSQAGTLDSPSLRRQPNWPHRPKFVNRTVDENHPLCTGLGLPGCGCYAQRGGYG